MIPCLFPQADDNFWKVKYDHEAAKLARATKKTERKAARTGTSKKKNPIASDMFKLDDSSSDGPGGRQDMTFFFGRWPDFTNSDSLLLVTMDGTQLQVTGALAALGAMMTVGL